MSGTFRSTQLILKLLNFLLHLLSWQFWDFNFSNGEFAPETLTRMLNPVSQESTAKSIDSSEPTFIFWPPGSSALRIQSTAYWLGLAALLWDIIPQHVPSCHRL